MGIKELKVIRDILLLVEDEVPNKEFLKLKKLKTLNEDELAELTKWAVYEHLIAGDHNEKAKSIPKFIKL